MMKARLSAVLLACLVLVTVPGNGSMPIQQDSAAIPLDGIDQELLSGLEDRISTSEWLGPLAPIAISPFFGITCLAGMSQFGGDYLGTNAFVSRNPVLHNPYVFWIFLTLTVATSLPRLTKVSKPIAQALDQVETYAGIITLVVLRFAVAPQASPDPMDVVQMGFFSSTMDGLLILAAAINVVVINSVKFFIEVMVWLMPFPFVDGMLEVANKAICAGLMAVYMWSPLVATMINLAIFAICLVVFNWTRRRVGYLRNMLLDPVLSLFGWGKRNTTDGRLMVFLQGVVGGLPSKSRVWLETTEQGWRIIEYRMFFSDRVIDLPRNDVRLVLLEGQLLNTIQMLGSPEGCLLFSRRFGENLAELGNDLRLNRSTEPMSEILPV